MECKKCKSKNLFLQEKGTQTGLYCKECGAWQKWVPKKDIDTISAIINMDKADKSKTEIHTKEEINFVDKLKEYILTYEKSETKSAEEEDTLERFLAWIKYKEFK